MWFHSVSSSSKEWIQMLLMLPFIFSPFARQFVFIRNRQVWNNLAFEALHLFRDRFNGRSKKEKNNFRAMKLSSYINHNN